MGTHRGTDYNWFGIDFNISKFNNPENMVKALHGAPKFVTGNFLSIRQREPNFEPEEVIQTHLTIWIGLS